MTFSGNTIFLIVVQSLKHSLGIVVIFSDKSTSSKLVQFSKVAFPKTITESAI